MYYHLKKNHTSDDSGKFICEHCPPEAPMKFIQKSAYQQHLATKHKEIVSETEEKNPYAGVTRKCPACDHTTHTKSNLIIHFARTHCKEWIPSFTKDSPTCKGCDKDFASSTAYLYHAISCIKPIPEDQANMLSLIK
jgi:hypothetical protein